MKPASVAILREMFAIGGETAAMAQAIALLEGVNPIPPAPTTNPATGNGSADERKRQLAAARAKRYRESRSNGAPTGVRKSDASVTVRDASRVTVGAMTVTERDEAPSRVDKTSISSSNDLQLSIPGERESSVTPVTQYLSRLPSRPSRAEACPKIDATPDEVKAWAWRVGLGPVMSHALWEKFLRVFRANGKPKKCWRSTWLNFEEGEATGRYSAPGVARAASSTSSAAVESKADYAARMRRQDAEHERLKAEAVPAPIGDLLAAVGRKP